ncbi:GSCOCG00011736001-RA-CDS [Cotesia congregata]|nr:GSCOCG00011736001-RA-CDS [Cotesia congregata]
MVEQNDLDSVLENPIDMMTTFKTYDDHNYSSTSFQEQDKNSNINTSIHNSEIDNSSDAELSSKYNNMQNDSVISVENHNDLTYYRNFYGDKNHCLNISISDVENSISLDTRLIDTVSEIVTITCTDTIDNSIHNLSLTKLLDNEKKIYKDLTLKQNSLQEPLSLAIENMMKQKTLNKKHGHYFQGCPEAALLNNLVDEKKSTSTKKSKNFLLRNGNKTGPVQFGRSKWTALNTCPFDTIIQIIFTVAIDNTHYRDFISKSNLQTFKFLKNFMINGATQKIYEHRMAILNPIYNTKKLEDDMKIKVAPYINCHDNIIKLWKVLFEDVPSVIETTVCSNSLCQTYMQAFPVISVNHKIITRHGFTALEKAIEFNHKIYNVHCRFCCKAIATRTTVPKQYLLIELDVRDNKCGRKGKKCKLSELPIHLHLKLNDDKFKTNLHYRLSGVAAFSTGHYFAYCRRLGGNWQVYNDLSIKRESASVHTEVESHAVFYVLE